MNAPLNLAQVAPATVSIACDTRSGTITSGKQKIRASPSVLKMAALLSKVHPQPIARDRMMKHLFSGTPDVKDPATAMRQTMKRARETLKPLGLTIHYTPNPSGSHLPGYYALVRYTFCAFPRSVRKS